MALVCGVLFALAVQSSEAFAASFPQVSLPSVSCGAAGDCTAVGGFEYPPLGLLLSETGGTWAPGIEPPLPANAAVMNPYAYLFSVSCASAGSCTAVGWYYDSSGNSPGLLLTETNGVWAREVEAPGGPLHSVSCAAAGDCTAVGSLLLTETNGVWAPGVEPGGGDLWSVSCAAPGDCAAVGGGALLTETNGVWAPGVEASLPANASSNPNVTLSSVSCAAAGDCSAVGSYYVGLWRTSSYHPEGLLLTETNGVWAPGVEATLPANASSNPNVTLSSVSCAAAGDCTAIGGYIDSSGRGQGLLLGESGGSWSTGIEAPLPANAGTNSGGGLGSVSCASAGDCSAVGYYDDSSGNTQGLLLTERRGAWEPGLEATLPANAGSNPGASLNSVSCPSAGDCTAVGTYSCGQGLLLTETGGVWEPGVEATLPASAGLSGLGCPVALSRLRVSPKTFVLTGRRVNGRCLKQTANNYTHRRCRRPIKLAVGYTLNSPAIVTFTLKRLAPGRRVNGRCVKPTNTNNRHKRCTRLVSVPGKITVSGAAGADSFTFHGRIGGKTLGPGSYRLTATPKVNGQADTSRTIAFKITA